MLEVDTEKERLISRTDYCRDRGILGTQGGPASTVPATGNIIKCGDVTSLVTQQDKPSMTAIFVMDSPHFIQLCT